MNTVTSLALLLLIGTPDDRQAMTSIVAKIQRADYAGDRAALRRLHQELEPFVEHRELASRALYWRGFAMWRRALNGFNESAERKELDEDMTQCIADFRQAINRDPAFVDAKIGAASCLVNLSFLHVKQDPARARELYPASLALLNEAAAAAPDNPRLLWVQGGNQWYTPPDRGGGHDVALATYERGLALARKAKESVTDPLEPTWGEAELLMNLAFANLNRATPDLTAAETYVQRALALVPYWHYVRNILLVQIRDAKSGSRGMSVSTSPEQARKLADELYAAWSLHELDRIDAIFTNDAVYEDVAGGQIRRGTSEIKDLLRAAFTFAPDFKATLQSFVIAGDTATTEWVIEGTQTGSTQAGSIGALSGTGRRFRLRGASILVFRASRIAQVRDYYDMATFLRQLGAKIELPKP